MSHVYLKVKLKSLMEEAKIIRKEEARAPYVIDDDGTGLRNSLHRHRVIDVRSEARSTHLAYALLRGKTLNQVEIPGSRPPDIPRIIDMVKKYGTAGSKEVAKALVEDFMRS